MLHRVGTRVRIKSKKQLQELEDKSRGDENWSGLASSMTNYAGLIATITKTYLGDSDEFFLVDLDGQNFVWCNQMVEPVAIERNLPTWW